mmetsp:Transcript_54634/g.84966  ORF Transcript_54634/g.84966 Transcript_54634/m.84966 type:complete len:142 (+) Transcript_54634:36-461(+)
MPQSFLNSLGCAKLCCAADDGNGDIVERVIKKDAPVPAPPPLKTKEATPLLQESSPPIANRDSEREEPPKPETTKKVSKESVDPEREAPPQQPVAKQPSLDVVDEQMRAILKDVYEDQPEAANSSNTVDRQMKHMLADLGL